MSLTREEIEALRGISRRMMQPVLPQTMTDRLISLRLVDQKLGGFVLTREGEKQLKAAR